MCDICLFEINDIPLFGEILNKSDITVHYLCLLSSNIPQIGRNLNNGIKGFLLADIRSSLQNIKNNKCFICKKKNAAVVCSHKNCNKKWHYICGRKNLCITQFTGKYNSYCNSHVPDSNPYQHPEPVSCSVCYELIEKYHPANSLISKCCLEIHRFVNSPYVAPDYIKKVAFIHSECIQRYAYNAGSLAKCHWCIMKSCTIEEFQDDLRKKGIFVPMKDAEWEKDPYFKNMVKNKCASDNCPKSLDTKNVWTCIVCGCHPRHLSCAGVKRVEEYYCVMCIDQSFVERVPFTSRYSEASTSKSSSFPKTAT